MLTQLTQCARELAIEETSDRLLQIVSAEPECKKLLDLYTEMSLANEESKHRRLSIPAGSTDSDQDLRTRITALAEPANGRN